MSKLGEEKNNFQEYLKEIKKQSTKNKSFWWPKIYIEIPNSSLNNYIDNLEYITNNYYHLFPNDGWIIQSSNTDLSIFKLKPLEHLTIDIKYENKSWISQNNSNIENKFGISINTTKLNSIKNCIYRVYFKDNEFYRQMKGLKK